MNRTLLRSSAFVRAARKVLKRQPGLAEALRSTLERLATDAHQAALKTHKLKGDLEGSWACSVAHDMRIVFRFVEHEGVEMILLDTIGTHEEVY